MDLLDSDVAEFKRQVNRLKTSLVVLKVIVILLAIAYFGMTKSISNVADHLCSGENLCGGW